MGGRTLRTGRRLYGGHSGFSPGELPDVAQVRMAESLPNETDLTRGKLHTASDTEGRLYGVAQGSERETTQPEEYMPIKVLVADDHPIFRDGVVALLKLEEDIEIVGEADNGKEALDMIKELSPDVVLMDLLMPVMDGLEATKRIRAAGWPTTVLMLSQYDDEANVIACSEAGAASFIPKTKAGSVLLDGIRSLKGAQRS